MVPIASPVLADIVSTVEKLDRDAMHFLTCKLYHPIVDPIVLTLQEKTVAIPVMLVALGLVAVWRPRRALRATLACLLAIGLAMGLASILWPLIGRPRPPAAYEQHLITPEEIAACAEHPEALPLRKDPAHSPSFPSRHALTAGVFAAIIWLASWRMGIFAAIYAALVVFGRVYAAKHWPSDVIVGALLGVGLACLAWWAVPRLLRRIGHEDWVLEPDDEAQEPGAADPAPAEVG